MKYTRGKWRGFALIEILVVIGIGGILAALLVPALGRARDSANRAMCANNLRQLGIAFALYLQEHNEIYPAWQDRRLSGEPGYGVWMGRGWRDIRIA